MVVYLGFWVALGAHSVDDVVSWKTSAGSDYGVPDFVIFAFGMTNSVG